MSESINCTPPEESFVVPFAADEDSPYIFISYAHDDRERVFPIITRLYEQGWRIWCNEGILPSANYNSVITSHISNCALLLMFVTHNACERLYVIENEVEYAIRKKRREQTNGTEYPRNKIREMYHSIHYWIFDCCLFPLF